LDPRLTPRNGLSIEETIRRIEDCKSWMVLKRVEQVPEYKSVLDAWLDEVAASLGLPAAALIDRAAFIFVSSPGAITPFHMDPELNFLLQLRGTKKIHIFPKQLVTDEEIEKRFAGAHRNLAYSDNYEALARVFELHAGDGVHVPIAAPHWVEVGNDFSISFSVTFHTPATERHKLIQTFNGKLRRLGMRPVAVGRYPWRDSLKFHAYRYFQQLKRLRG
jgi:ribosomal protein L16 Arg81 hydroxylase